MKEIKPIETKYKGYRFRSRLEARWGVFFDALKFKWEYEIEGFVLPGGVHYLPDFKVTSPEGLISWYEVKPRDNGECDKIKLFEKQIFDKDNYHQAFFTLQGDPVDFITGDIRVCPSCGNIEKYSVSDEKAQYVYFNCWFCDANQERYSLSDGFRGGVLAVAFWHKGELQIFHMEYEAYLAKVEKAKQAARSARFEHGETPK